MITLDVSIEGGIYRFGILSFKQMRSELHRAIGDLGNSHLKEGVSRSYLMNLSKYSYYFAITGILVVSPR
jgi:hypothetical protein